MAEKYELSLRRLRQSPLIRSMVKETRVSVDQMIQPLFVVEGLRESEEIPGLIGTRRDTTDTLLRTIERDLEKQVKRFLLFCIPQGKEEKSFCFDFSAQQVHEVKSRFGKDLLLAVDVCLCGSTSHGHCGLLDARGERVENESSVKELARMGLAFAQAGADCVAPSDMMDGRVGALRKALQEAGNDQTLIMSYSAKFHSHFYGPFREATGSAPQKNEFLKDRASYQIDPAFATDATLSALRDAEEGADILMVRPGLPYLDILARLSEKIPKPWAVYQVSGEYASIELLARQGLMNGPAAHVEAWTAFVRAGASMIITYGARHAADYLKNF